MSEEKWLETREALQFISGRCYIYDRKGNVCPNPESDLMPREDPLHTGVEDYRDAAEFEARVAAKLADWAADGIFSKCEFCLHNNECMDDSKFPCRWFIIKEARLAVEEEMDNEE